MKRNEAATLSHWPRNGVAIRVPARRAAVGSDADPPSCEVIEFAGLVAEAPRTVSWDALATGLPRGSRVVLLVAAEDVSFVVADVPDLSGLRLREALPNLVEERTVGEVGSLHVALGRAPAAALGEGSDRTRVLAVVDRTWLATIQVHAVRAGLRVSAILAESLTVPWPRDAWSLAASGSAATGLRLWFRSDEQRALPLPAEGAAAMVGAVLRGTADGTRPKHLNVYAAPAIKADVKTIGEEIARETGLPLHDAGGDPFVEWLAAGGPEGGFGSPLSLLSSDTGHGGRWAGWQQWRITALLLVALAVVQVAGMQWQWAGLRAEASSLRRDANDTLKAAFPDTRVVLDPALQMSQGLAALRASSGRNDPGDFTVMIAAVGRIFAPLPSNALRAADYDARALRLKFAPGTVAADQQPVFIAQARQLGYGLRFENAAATGEVQATLSTRGVTP